MYKQYSISIVFLHKMKPKPDKCENFIQEYYDIIEAPQEHFCTMGKYISDDVFVSVSASRSSKSWEIAVRFIISLWLLLDPVLHSWLHISSVTCLSFCSDLAVCSPFAPVFHLIAFVFCILHWFSTELTVHFFIWNFLQIHLVLYPLLWQTNLMNFFSSHVNSM